MFLDASDLAQMLLVCLPWSRALDHGYVWQAFLGRDTLAARRPKVWLSLSLFFLSQYRRCLIGDRLNSMFSLAVFIVSRTENAWKE
jgi:hypothetical protein